MTAIHASPLPRAESLQQPAMGFARRSTGREAHRRMRGIAAVGTERLRRTEIVVRERAGEALAVERALSLGPSGERFVYLRGRSGRRYVFSAVRSHHAGLYAGGLFAEREGEGATLLCDGADPRAVTDGTLYVHLVSRTAEEREAVRRDLAG